MSCALSVVRVIIIFIIIVIIIIIIIIIIISSSSSCSSSSSSSSMFTCLVSRLNHHVCYETRAMDASTHKLVALNMILYIGISVYLSLSLSLSLYIYIERERETYIISVGGARNALGSTCTRHDFLPRAFQEGFHMYIYIYIYIHICYYYYYYYYCYYYYYYYYYFYCYITIIAMINKPLLPVLFGFKKMGRRGFRNSCDIWFLKMPSVPEPPPILLRPISALRFRISKGLIQAES